MTSPSLLESVRTTTVGMGQIVAACKPDRLTAVLGSCVGVALWHPRLGVGALAHVVLPDSAGRPAAPGKFADTAVPQLIRELEQQGAPRSGLIAKLAGGACMFGPGGPLQIGDANAEAVLKALAKAGIRAAAQDLGGKSGRRIHFDCATGQLTVDTAGGRSIVL